MNLIKSIRKRKLGNGLGSDFGIGLNNVGSKLDTFSHCINNVNI